MSDPATAPEVRHHPAVDTARDHAPECWTVWHQNCVGGCVAYGRVHDAGQALEQAARLRDHAAAVLEAADELERLAEQLPPGELPWT